MMMMLHDHVYPCESVVSLIALGFLTAPFVQSFLTSIQFKSPYVLFSFAFLYKLSFGVGMELRFAFLLPPFLLPYVSL